MAERYNTPTEGTLDWHIPLNENFNKLDKHVELRDSESNLGSYEPTSGSKFLATDTGVVYVGDGSQWNQIGSISTTSSGSSAEMIDGTLVAEPGDVQSTIDAVSTDWQFGGGTFHKVTLKTGEFYRPSAPIEVPNGVYLDCNGATIVPDGDHNGMEIGQNAWVENPHVYTKGIDGYSSAAIEISPEWSEFVNGLNPARVTNALVHGAKGEGVGIRYRGGPDPCGLVRVTGHVVKFEKGIQFKSFGGDTSGRGDWSNGNQFHGYVGQSDVMIHLESSGAETSGNTVFAQIQTSSNTNWVVRQEDDPRDGDRIDPDYNYRCNNYFLFPWDTHNVDNEYKSDGDRRAPIWYIGKGQHARNVLYDLSAIHSNEFVVNNSDLPSRNAIFAGQPADMTGTTNFTTNPTFDPHSDYQTWHPDSTN